MRFCFTSEVEEMGRDLRTLVYSAMTESFV